MLQAYLPSSAAAAAAPPVIDAVKAAADVLEGTIHAPKFALLDTLLREVCQASWSLEDAVGCANRYRCVEAEREVGVVIG